LSCPYERFHKLLQDETHPDFFLVWEVADGMCVSPMTDALNSDKAVLVQSGLSLAQANPQKKKGDPLV